MKHIKTSFAAILLLLLLSACGNSSVEKVIVAGSTSVQPYAEVLAEEFSILVPDSEVDVQGGGSSAGISAAEDNTADIGMSSRGLKDSEMDLWHIEIAKDGLVMIVNPANSVSDLTLEQIRGIYTKSIGNWSELGGTDAKIHVIAREEGSGTRDAFESLIMGGEWVTPKAIIQNSNGAVKQIVSSDPNAIGFISLGLADSDVKVLNLDGVTPSGENVKNGLYSLYRPFLFVSSRPPEGAVKRFIDFTCSAEGQKLLADEGLIPMEGN
ncbi:MAG: phosphate ABC transporter substrate-binding protein [Oscillospiraceae bacterium]|nr:phosphate ABC transporter substrate-binding protein [Oscillospiraceae bacterium]